jgi:hypothetical protein
MYLNHPLEIPGSCGTQRTEKLAKFQMHLVLAYIFTHDIWVRLNAFPHKMDELIPHMTNSVVSIDIQSC